ncbi:hypothetical protein [Pseudomonas aeruginosa]|uniref:hypothetical protein n=1 Tax=Pseudomonas aeruginosa TaxID=287 RepID=UPI0012AD205D|nr:hypothetical protein [Pseudomonas aeruginosa]MEC4074659.1 hypothetical protein [Pseudomonas aeruginosa]HEP9713068.1 hypothetical protein [Pseudomonas aeruginosa]
MDELFMAPHLLKQRILDRLKNISNVSLEKNLDRLRAQLKDFYANTPTEHDRAATEIRKVLDNEQALATLIIGWEKAIEHEKEKLKRETSEKEKEQHQKEIERLKFSLPIKHTTLYIELALKAKSAGKTEQAWAYALEAAHLCGEISSHSIIEFDTLTIEKTSKQNSNNAKGINRKLLLLKEYIANLIIENTPQEGWRTKNDAITTIASLKSTNKTNEKPKTLIEEFIEKNDIKRAKPSNIINLLLKNWTNEPGAIQDALKKAISQKINERTTP